MWEGLSHCSVAIPNDSKELCSERAKVNDTPQELRHVSIPNEAISESFSPVKTVIQQLSNLFNSLGVLGLRDQFPKYQISFTCLNLPALQDSAWRSGHSITLVILISFLLSSSLYFSLGEINSFPHLSGKQIHGMAFKLLSNCYILRNSGSVFSISTSSDSVDKAS